MKTEESSDSIDLGLNTESASYENPGANMDSTAAYENSDSNHCESLLLFDVMADDSDSDVDIIEMIMSSDDEDITDALALYISIQRGPQHCLPRIENYIEKTVSEYSREAFKSHFRMYPETMEFILELISPAISGKNRGRKPIDAKKQLLLTLWVMATPDSYRSVCEKFNVGKATAIRTVRRVSRALYSLAPRFIMWPTGQRAKDVARQFEQYSAFPGVVGAIDGTHIKINAPKSDAESYINRKGTHSIQVQAVCQWVLSFTSMFAGSVGSVHDARVFRLSLVNNYLQNPDIYFPDNMHLVGDAAYGIHQYLLVPFKDNGHLTSKQKNYNFCHSSARMAIERAFGVWKARWRSILDCLPMVTIEKIPEYLLATAVLHNICILRGDIIPAEQQLRLTRRGLLIESGRDSGIRKRNEIMNDLIIRNN